jgi:hypothetical protein
MDLGRIQMHEHDSFEEHKHDGFLIFACFLCSALAGYIVMNHYALFGI